MEERQKPTVEESKITEKKIVYYSDFDTSLESWKMEQEYISTYSINLQQLLTDSWKKDLDTALQKPAVISRNSFEVALEYLLLTQSVNKEFGKLLSELEAYYNFYGYQTMNSIAFSSLMNTFLIKYKETETVIAKYKELNNKYELAQREAAYKGIKPPSKEQEKEFLIRKKKKQTKFMVSQRVVTPLFVAVEKVCTSENGKQTIKMAKTDESPYDVFSLGMLKAVFTYIDFEILKAPFTPNYLVMGNFAAVILEITSAELKGIREKLGTEVDKGADTYLRIIKPYRMFYRTLVAVLLKFGLSNFLTVDLADFLAASEHSLKEIWRPELKAPSEVFYGWCRFLLMNKPQYGIVEFFENLKCQMFKEWESGVVVKADGFKKVEFGSTTTSFRSS